MRRFLQTFSRHPWLYLLPLAITLAASAILADNAVRNAAPYTAEAVVAVNLDPGRERPVGERPPAQQYAELLGELMRTDEFVLTALDQTDQLQRPAELYSEPGFLKRTLQLAVDRNQDAEGEDSEPGFLKRTLQQYGLLPALSDSSSAMGAARTLRSRWKQSAVGANTFQVSFQCRQASFCTQFMSAVLTNFSDQILNARITQKKVAADYYQKQVESAQERLRSTPPSDPGYAAARQTYETLLSRMLEAGVNEALEAQAGQGSFTIISPPHLAGPPTSPLLQAAVPLMLGLIIGLAICIVGVAMGTWLDSSLRSPGDVRDELGLPTVAVVPPREDWGLGTADQPRKQVGTGTRLATADGRPGPNASASAE